MHDPALDPQEQDGLAAEKMSDEELAAIAADGTPEPVQFTVAPHELLIQQASVDLRKNPETGDVMLVLGPILLTIGVPMPRETAHALARGMTGGIEIASAIPKVVKP